MLCRAALCLVLLATAGCGPPRFLVDHVASHNPEVFFRASVEDSVVALTIDDGPHPTLTPRILTTLRHHDARATFFVPASRVSENASLVEQITADGHELGNHMMTTRPSILMSASEFERRLLQADTLLAPYGPIRWVRPASGWLDNRMRRIAEHHGYEVALGTVYPNDAWNPFPSYLASYILQNIQPGDVIILHEGTADRRSIIDVLDRVLPALERRGYRIVTLSTLAALGSNAK